VVLIPIHQTQEYSLMSVLEDKELVELLLSFLQTNAQRQLRTSELSALVKRELEEVESHFITKDVLSIELSQISWPREVISPLEMVLVVNPSMDLNSKMKISLLSTLQEVICPWPMLDQTLTALNSS
jgi:hypothetical protein